MVSGNDINYFFSTYEPTINGFGVICGILGFIGSVISGIWCCLNSKKAKKAERELQQFKVNLDKLEFKNSQMAKVINNYGLSYHDVKEVASDVVIHETKNKPDVYMQSEEPVNAKHGSIWCKFED